MEKDLIKAKEVPIKCYNYSYESALKNSIKQPDNILFQN